MASFKDDYYETVETDNDGRFYLSVGEIIDSSAYILNVIPRRRATRMELLIDSETFPDQKMPAVTPAEIDWKQFAVYAEKTEHYYMVENGMRYIQLPEVIVKPKPQKRSQFYSSSFASYSITQEELEQFRPATMEMLLSQLPGVNVRRISGSLSVTIRDKGSEIMPILSVNDIILSMEDLDLIDPSNVVQVDLLTGAKAMFFGKSGIVLSIFTKHKIYDKIFPSFHIKSFFPLGYQQPVEFYMPKYDTPEKRNTPTPDLRTTIHWQPVVQTADTGVASFEFYTADETTSYTVIIEGLTDDGRIIRQEGKIEVRKN